MKRVETTEKHHGCARKVISSFLALLLVCASLPADPPALAMANPLTVGATAALSGRGAITVVKEGTPITARNAQDRFPITVELVNEHGYDLEGVTVSWGEACAQDSGAASGSSLACIARSVSSAVAAFCVRGYAPPPISSGTGPLVALIDTGVQASESVVARCSVIGGDPGDDNGHGSAMLEAITKENPEARVLSVKALDASGHGTSADVFAAIELALEAGADIINLSLSARDCAANVLLAKGVKDAISQGATVVAAAGNGGYDADAFFPANVSGVLTVGAADADGCVLRDSNRGGCVDAYVTAESTSQAAARVSGWLSSGSPSLRVCDLAESGLCASAGADVDAEGLVEERGEVLPDRLGDGVSVAATYTVTLNYNANGGSIADSGGIHYAANKDEYYKVVSNILYMSTSKNGTYQKATGTVKSTETYHNLQDIATWGLTRTGYHIEGAKAYNTKANGTGLNISEHNSASDSTNAATAKRLNGNEQVTSNKTITIYVNWIANTYTVAYDANGGTGAPSSTSHTYGAAKSLASGKPTRVHYTFAGWQINGTGSVYAAGQSVSNLTTVNGGTVTMKAKWVEDPKYTVTYAGNGGTSARASDTVYSGTTVSLPGATRAGYSFKGWATSSGASSGITGNYTVNGNVTLYATWQENDRVVTYDGNGGTPSRSSDTVVPGSSVSLPSVSRYPSDDLQDTGSYCTVTLSGNGGTVNGRTVWSQSSAQYRDYGFSGWYTASSGGSYVGGSGGSYTPPQGTTALYMHWSVTYRYRSMSLPTPVRDGYEFRGWSTTSSASSGVTGSYVPSGTTTLYATWTAYTRRTITVRPVAGQTVTLSEIPEGTTYTVIDGEQPRRWELVSESPQIGAVPQSGTVRVTSKSVYSEPPEVDLSFSVPTRIGFVAKADGTLIGPSDGTVRIESATDAPIAVTGVKVGAEAGFEIVSDSRRPGQIAFSFAPEGAKKVNAADVSGNQFTEVRWPIASCGSLSICGLSGRTAYWGDLTGTARKVCSITWQLALDEDA